MFNILKFIYEAYFKRKKIVFGQNVIYERWEPKVDDRYFYIPPRMQDPSVATFSSYDLEYVLDSDNYFMSMEHAKEARKRIKEVLKAYHEELGY